MEDKFLSYSITRYIKENTQTRVGKICTVNHAKILGLTCTKIPMESQLCVLPERRDKAFWSLMEKLRLKLSNSLPTFITELF